MLFSASVWHLADRDRWIGWGRTDREKRLNLVINNSRFLIFPWVNVPNLASHVLSRVSAQIRDDWHQAHAYRPVLIETLVDTSRYAGTCYQAANWVCIGQSSGKDWKGLSADKKGSIKSIFVYPLHPNFRALLTNHKPTPSHKLALMSPKIRNRRDCLFHLALSAKNKTWPFLRKEFDETRE